MQRYQPTSGKKKLLSTSHRFVGGIEFEGPGFSGRVHELQVVSVNESYRIFVYTVSSARSVVMCSFKKNLLIWIEQIGKLLRIKIHIVFGQ